MLSISEPVSQSIYSVQHRTSDRRVSEFFIFLNLFLQNLPLYNYYYSLDNFKMTEGSD